MSERRSRGRKSWREKLMDDKDLPKIVRPDRRKRKTFAGKTMLIPRPRDVDAAIRKVRKGRLVTIGEIREFLAREHGADTTCPLTTGIFLRITAEAAEEDRRDGKKRITPYWRVIRDDGSLNPKFPGGVAAQARRLREEGHVITRTKGKARLKVRDFGRALVTLS